MRLRLAIAALAVWTAAVALLACGHPVNDRPTIEFISPLDGDTTSSTTVPVAVRITKMTLDPTILPPTDDGQPFHGHWELFLDFNFVADVVTTGTTLAVGAGPHVLDAVLVNQNDVPVSGVPFAQIDITVPSIPGVSVTTPAEGASIPSSSVDLGVAVSTFTLDSAGIGQPNAAGHGHLHVYEGSGTSGTLLADTASSSITITRLDELSSPSAPVLTVALVNNDHSLVSGATPATISIVRPFGSPVIHLDAPPAGNVPASVGIAVVTSNFTLVDWTGATADSAGQGHYEVLVDGAVVGHSFSTTTGATLSSGTHVLGVQLVGNLHDPLSPRVVDQVSVTAP